MRFGLKSDDNYNFRICIQLQNQKLFSGYFQFVLKTKTASACEGHKLKIKCPFKTTIAIQVRTVCYLLFKKMLL